MFGFDVLAIFDLVSVLILIWRLLHWQIQYLMWLLTQIKSVKSDCVRSDNESQCVLQSMWNSCLYKCKYVLSIGKLLKGCVNGCLHWEETFKLLNKNISSDKHDCCLSYSDIVQYFFFFFLQQLHTEKTFTQKYDIRCKGVFTLHSFQWTTAKWTQLLNNLPQIVILFSNSHCLKKYSKYEIQLYFLHCFYCNLASNASLDLKWCDLVNKSTHKVVTYIILFHSFLNKYHSQKKERKKTCGPQYALKIVSYLTTQQQNIQFKKNKKAGVLSV